ncbi:MAG: hypothetical protein AMK75_05670 [Planctomycetes bacterium SM23_65]|nr:MAG: hypothetical protein AMK75_05670 [Planctomycetes bacterium SM23_65]
MIEWESIWQLWLLGVIILIAGIVTWLGRPYERRRRRGLSKLASELGLHFSVADPLDLPERLSGFRVFWHGSLNKAVNVLHGEYQGSETIAFDFEYLESGGRAVFSVCLRPLGCAFPRLTIRPEGVSDKVGKLIGAHDIDFESDEFSRKFRVRSDNRKFAYDVCHPRMMALLLKNPGWSIQIADGYWALADGRRWHVADFPLALALTHNFFELIPDFVWREYREKTVES